jgi:LysM repeat protein
MSQHSLHAKILGLCLASLAVFAAACERQLIQVATQDGGGLSLVTATATPERAATLLELQGQVEARTNDANPWQPAREGQSLGKDGQVRTSGDGRALFRLTEGSKVRLGGDTFFTAKLLGPFLDNQDVSLHLEKGEVFVMLKGNTQLDVETPFGTAKARLGAYLSVSFDSKQQTVAVTCLQGGCSFGDPGIFIPAGFKLDHAEQPSAAPVRMEFSDYGVWGQKVPEATQLAYLATEAAVQGSATVPVVATPSPTPSPRPTATRPPPPTATRAPSATPPPAGTTPPPTPLPPTATLTPVPSPTPVTLRPTITAIPFTPLPPAPIIGRHLVKDGETLFCIARGYGVLPAAIAQANGLAAPFIVFPGQVLGIPAVQWTDILPGPVCQPQFVSPFPGLPFATNMPPATATPAGPPLTLALNLLCIFNCGSQDGDYVVHIEAQANGGLAPYTFTPGQTFDVTSRHCFTAGGLVTVTSADGQTTSAAWSYQDVSCPPTASP